MESKYVTIAIIPLRAGSQSIPLKNIKLLNGKPLALWGIEAACGAEKVDRVIVATDDDILDSTLMKYMHIEGMDNYKKLEFYRRSSESATDKASTEIVMKEVLEKYEAENYVLIQATSPLLSTIQLNEAFQKYSAEGYDSLLSGVRQKRFVWTEQESGVVPQNYNPLHRPMRQDFNGFLVENGAFYIGNVAKFLDIGSRLYGKIGLYEMQESSYFEIDEPEDWTIVEGLLKKEKDGEKALGLKNIQLLVLDCDGVLTDGKMYYNHSGEEMKAFSTRDGMGIGMLKEQGVEVAIISGEKNGIVESRAKKLGITHVYLGSKDKVANMATLINKLNMEYCHVAYIGDDVNDIEVIKRVGFSFAPADAMMEIGSLVDHVLDNNGGNGAVREVCDMIIREKTNRD